MRKWLIGAAVVVAALAVTGFVLFQNYWYYLPGIMASIRDPIQPNQPVVWDKGPAAAPTPAASRPPNIILILADDLGYNDITFNGGGVAGGAVPTPNIDSIGHDGVDLSESYAGNATCAPSRAAILTGRYATRFGFEFTPVPVQFSRLVGHTQTGIHPPIYHQEVEADVPEMAQMTVPTSEITLPQLLKTVGYHTIAFGKWHLGETAQTRPEARGFDEYLGFLAGASMYFPAGDPRAEESRQDFDPIDKFLWANLPYAVVNNSGPHRFAPSEYMTDYLADETVKAIGANKNRPFFMYVAFNAPHTPLQALKSDYDALPQIQNHRLRVYAAMIRALDRGVGKILDAVKANGLDDNTLIFFTSDNGGANYIGLPDINKPFRGWKMTFFEGGIRVPFFIKWPAKITKGDMYSGAVGHVDIFATAAAAAGAAMPSDRKMDGVNLMPFILGTSQGSPHQTMFWRSGGYRVLRAGDWKLQVSDELKKSWLFDMKNDPTEKTNLVDSQPDKLAELRAELDKINAEQAKPLWPSLLEGAVAIDHPLDAPEQPGEEYIYWAN
ncbi:MAG: sulfatase-like hydrolase/transferase [Alphaproteobacteria bacterium]|nr:sulfatase-like hydrolase/transferase [Alphaproteobacteria bacterium]